jgi:hypothetical protein
VRLQQAPTISLTPRFARSKNAGPTSGRACALKSSLQYLKRPIGQNYIYLIESGVMATSGKGADLIDNPHVQAAYLGG